MLWEQQIQFATISDIGCRRQINQDACAVHICSDQETWERSGHLFVVADGMGGHAVGELASKIAIDTIPHLYLKSKNVGIPEALKAAFQDANVTIYERGSQNVDFNHMGTTCVSLVLSPEGAFAAHVGDSRLYRIRNDRIDQLTFDHSRKWELMRNRTLKSDEVFVHESRHVITRSLGPLEAVEVDVEGPYSVFSGDIYLLCSDGLTGHVNDAEIGAIVRALPCVDACRLLVNLANLRGGSDNITVVISRVGELPNGLTIANRGTAEKAADGLGWFWLAGFRSVTIMFIIGVLLALLGNIIAGSAMVSLALAAALVLVLKLAADQPKQTGNHSVQAVHGRTYRTAPVKLTKAFLNQMAAMASRLQQVAVAEGWSLDPKTHEVSCSEARIALTERKYARALSGFAKSIDVLMAGVRSEHDKRNHQVRQGKTLSATRREAGGTNGERRKMKE